VEAVVVELMVDASIDELSVREYAHALICCCGQYPLLALME